MIELTYGQMKQNQDFSVALDKLKKCANFSPKVAYSVNKISSKILSEWKLADELQKNIWKKYCKKDEKGELIVTNGVSLEIEENHKADFTKEMKEYWGITFTIDWSKLKLDDLEAVKNPGLTPDELAAIEPLIYHLEEVKA